VEDAEKEVGNNKYKKGFVAKPDDKMTDLGNLPENVFRSGLHLANTHHRKVE